MKSLKQLRMERGMTQTELSKRLEISSKHMHHLENGKRRPSPEVATRIREFFGLKTEEIWSMFYDPGAGKQPA